MEFPSLVDYDHPLKPFFYLMVIVIFHVVSSWHSLNAFSSNLNQNLKLFKDFIDMGNFWWGLFVKNVWLNFVLMNLLFGKFNKFLFGYSAPMMYQNNTLHQLWKITLLVVQVQVRKQYKNTMFTNVSSAVSFNTRDLQRRYSFQDTIH